jgi:hypothetical protein
MPLAAYGGPGVQEGTTAATPAAASAGSASTADATPLADPAAVATPDTAPFTPSADELPVPDDEPSRGPGPMARVARVVRLFRTSRPAAGAGFAALIVVGFVILSSGGGSPAVTAATPTKAPAPVQTIRPPSGDASMTLAGAVKGTFSLTGMAGGQHVDSASVTLAWGDATQTTLTIAGPRDRGTRVTDEHLVLTIGAVIAGQPVSFTSTAGECTIGMAEVGTKTQGSFTCHKLKAPDGKLTIEASGTYRS